MSEIRELDLLTITQQTPAPRFTPPRTQPYVSPTRHLMSVDPCVDTAYGSSVSGVSNKCPTPPSALADCVKKILVGVTELHAGVGGEAQRLDEQLREIEAKKVEVQEEYEERMKSLNDAYDAVMSEKRRAMEVEAPLREVMQAVHKCQQVLGVEAETEESVCSTVTSLSPTVHPSAVPSSNLAPNTDPLTPVAKRPLPSYPDLPQLDITMSTPPPSSSIGVSGAWFSNAKERENMNSYRHPIEAKPQFPISPTCSIASCRSTGLKSIPSHHGPNSFTRPPKLQCYAVILCVNHPIMLC